MAHRVTLKYSDGTERTMDVAAGQTLLDAAEQQGLPVVSACQAGVCGTCVARCSAGEYECGPSAGLSPDEKAQGRLLCCQTRVGTDCVIELDYPLAANAARIVGGTATVVSLEHLSETTVLLGLDISDLPEPIAFKAGQFAQLRVPGCDVWRSYSFAHAPAPGAAIQFLIRLLPDGLMSEYLRTRARPGDRIGLRAPKGTFYWRESARPVVLVAGGTGLSALLAIAETLVERDATRPIRMIYGVANPSELVLGARLDALARRAAHFSWTPIVAHGDASWAGRVGVVTDLLPDIDFGDGDLDVYLCGPAAMIDATRRWLTTHGQQQANLYFEKFVASGTAGALSVVGAVSSRPDPARLRAQGRGTAVVLGGSIAGITTAKVLSEFFPRVVVLEQDPVHRRHEGRNGAAQGWHLHHLLIAGQRQLESIFPGIIDDMVAAGAFKVDMGEQYRMMLGGSWKKQVASGIDIVCAARPLLEWCVRRRLDAEPGIDYRYETVVRDLVLDPASGAIVGVVLGDNGREEVLAAEFVADCAGKNTPVPAILDRLGIGAPVVDEDCINCFYSTMQHRVPPERRWTDKVMEIGYAYRPHQTHYSAQFYADVSRTVLITSLVGYNCYRPPRNAEEFREFARLMPSETVGRELDGLEPCSPVYNFRYPTMQRFRYELKTNLPAGLVAVGDSYCSADPVSGAGMTKALFELNELRRLLRTGRTRDAGFVRDYYRAVGRIADRVWALVREQNLRYPWIRDRAQKRPFYASAQNWYVDRMLEAMHEDPDLYRRYLEVTHFIAGPASLLRPGVVARVLGRWLRTRLSGRQTLIERNFGASARDGLASHPETT